MPGSDSGQSFAEGLGASTLNLVTLGLRVSLPGHYFLPQNWLMGQPRRVGFRQ
jgi:hypothetical protein